MFVFEIFFDFITETILSIISACISIILLSAFIYAVIFIVTNVPNYITNARTNKKNKLIIRYRDCKITPNSNLNSDENIDIAALRNIEKELLGHTTASTKVTPDATSNGGNEVREFLERLIETFIGGSLDDVPLFPTYNNSQYDSFCKKYQGELTHILYGLYSALQSTVQNVTINELEGPSSYYAQLGSLVEKIQDDASNLPSLTEYENETSLPSFKNQLANLSYEEILSMAVLNKVVEKYQSVKGSSYASTDGSFSYPQSPSVSSERSSNSYYESTPETLSLTVEERIKEVTTRYITPEDDYETNQSMFSKFLPNLNFLKGKRALFPEFGKDVVDASSDSHSENKNNDSCDDDSGVNEPAIDRYIIDAESIQNIKKYDDLDRDSSGVASTSKDTSDMLSSGSITQSDDECGWTGISKTDFKDNIAHPDSEDAGPIAEFVSDSSSKEEISLSENNYNNENVSSLAEELSTPPKPGTIAEREHKKWSEATPLDNNPYSKENIEKRNYDKLLPTMNSKNESNDREIAEMQELNAVEIHVRTLSVDYQKYSRDYYTNQDQPLPDDCTKEVTIENGEKSKPEYDSMKLNGNVKKTKLVRVLSWSDREKPQIKSNGNAHPRLPSVKELAKQFSGRQNGSNENEKFKPKQGHNKQVHSLTARSMSREFREGLKQHNNGKTFNRNISATDILNEKSDDQDLNDNTGKIQECEATLENSNGKC